MNYSDPTAEAYVRASEALRAAREAYEASPQTPALILARDQAAREYEAAREAWKSSKLPVSPEPDLLNSLPEGRYFDGTYEWEFDGDRDWTPIMAPSGMPSRPKLENLRKAVTHYEPLIIDAVVTPLPPENKIPEDGVVYMPPAPAYEVLASKRPAPDAKQYPAGTLYRSGGILWECYFDEQDRQNEWREASEAAVRMYAGDPQ